MTVQMSTKRVQNDTDNRGEGSTFSGLTPQIVCDGLQMSDLLRSQPGNIERATIIQPEQIVGTDTECLADFNEHVDWRLDIATFPIGDTLLTDIQFLCKLYLI